MPHTLREFFQSDAFSQKVAQKVSRRCITFPNIHYLSPRSRTGKGLQNHGRKSVSSYGTPGIELLRPYCTVVGVQYINGIIVAREIHLH